MSMLRLRGVLSWTASALLLLQLSTSTLAEAPETSNNDECGLYLALSSTSSSEHSAWGIYAGKHIAPETPIGYPEIGINIPHLKANTFVAQQSSAATKVEDEEYLGQIVDFIEEIIWVSGPAGARFELEKGRSVAAIPGAGALSAFNAKFVNANWNSTAAYKRPAWGEEPGIAHPNRGATSHFYHVVMQSTEEIPAGSEIFMDYGDNWAEEETEDDPTSDDYDRIDQTVDQMIAFFEKHKDSLKDDTTKIQVYQFLVKDVLTAAVGTGKARKIAGILPPRPDDLHKVKEAGGALKYSVPSVARNTEWLKQHGRCMDNIRPGPSTIPHAGRGAFSTRFIPAGELVAPVPLVHIPDKTILDMHELTQQEDGDFVRESNQVVHKQLLLNYAYGHPESSMVFYPTGAVASFINHNHDKAAINAKLTWSTHPNNNAKVWFEQSPRELMAEENQHIGLLMEIVATRDIQPGEEIFLDYGPEWEGAWSEHVQVWEQRLVKGEIPSTWPVRAVDLMEQYRNAPIPYKTVEELAADPYPDTVVLKAYLTVLESDHKGTLEDPSTWGAEEDVDLYNYDHLRDIVVVDRMTVEDVADDGKAVISYEYTVNWTSSRGKTVYVSGVPHTAFVFVDAPGKSDQFAVGTFRHFIGIPDDIFPQGPWRNLAA